MVHIHPSDSVRFTERAQIICLLTNAYKFLNPESTFREMGDHLGISEWNARRYYYGLYSLNDPWRKGCYQMCRRGASTPLMNRVAAESVLSALPYYHLCFQF